MPFGAPWTRSTTPTRTPSADFSRISFVFAGSAGRWTLFLFTRYLPFTRLTNIDRKRGASDETATFALTGNLSYPSIS